MGYKNNLIVLEGIDGSGKHTQAVMLVERLRAELGVDVTELSYPCYGTDHCKLVEMYLSGEFGKSGLDTSPYPASVFYAVDRYGDYKINWSEKYAAGDVILTDRYTTSNLTCQASKLSGSLRDEYLSWVQDFEYSVMGLPRPGLVIYLDVTAEISHAAMGVREKLDIHECDIEFMRGFRRNGLDVAARYGWTVLDCCEGSVMRDVHSINDDLFAIVSGHLRRNVI